MSNSLTSLVQMLAGGFSNQEQAFENPPLYAHILVHVRPVPHLAAGSLLLEQSYAIEPGRPYRIRVLRVESHGEQLIIENQALRQEDRFWGATQEPERMAAISAEDLQPLEGCRYVVRAAGSGFVGEVEPGCRCLVERKGSTAYLVSRFEIEPGRMQTIDRGHDPVSHEHLWGSLAGPFDFRQTETYQHDIPASWLQQWRA
ncbi:MAG: chromophore lyase CpcT/CpeT [Prochlorococcaceae cyanobacterium]